jgi:hypothetical protein
MRTMADQRGELPCGLSTVKVMGREIDPDLPK